MNYVPKIKPVVEQVGAYVLSQFRAQFDLKVKSDGSIATEVDVESERRLKEGLVEIIPGAGFYTEEAEEEQGNEYRWIIDPIDGTKNFACGIPYFCVAVALERDGEVIAAVTYAPYLNEWFCAEQGQGMYWNDRKVNLEGDYWKKRTALMIERHSSISRSKTYKILKEAGLSGSFRYYGAAALDLCYIAIGSIDMLVSESIYWWDIAGGLLMVKEAGGCVRNIPGKATERATHSIYAGKFELYDLLFEKNNSF